MSKTVELNGKPVSARPALYAQYYQPLKEIALKYGYNLLIHGSMNRDFDLVAVPWAKEIGDHLTMMEEMKDYLGGRFLRLPKSEHPISEVLQHGRVSYVINLYRHDAESIDHQYYLDVAVFQSTTPSPDVAGSDAVAFAEWLDSGRNYHKRFYMEGKYRRERSYVELVAIFTTEQHHQPAGASVDYSIRSMAPVGFGDLFEALYNFFHCETDGKGIAWEALQKEYKKCEQDGRVSAFQAAQSQPAPAAVSAGTWRKTSDGLPKDDGIYHIKLDGESKRLGCFYVQDGKKFCHVLTNGAAPDFEVGEDKYPGVEWLDESAPGIPDVRELVEKAYEAIKWLNRIMDDYDGEKISGAEVLSFTIDLQTALAGIKRK